VKRAILCAFVAVVLQCSTWAGGLDKDKTMYVGGTLNTPAPQTIGKCSAADEKVFVFIYSGGKLTIPYSQVNELEYGQKAGRRLGVSVVAPMFLLSHKRRHFLTISYIDDDQKQQALVFELGKEVVRVTITTLEARTGKKVEYQDEESRNSGMGD